MFALFAQQLDQSTELREQLIKLSRELTLNSKRSIYALQRMSDAAAADDGSGRSNALKDADSHLTECRLRLERIRDLPAGQGGRVWPHKRSYTGGLQEFIEALCFRRFLVAYYRVNGDDNCYQLDWNQLLTEYPVLKVY
jgi:predicted translin family RNA/ssDNA-binding protein